MFKIKKRFYINARIKDSAYFGPVCHVAAPGQSLSSPTASCGKFGGSFRIFCIFGMHKARHFKFDTEIEHNAYLGIPIRHCASKDSTFISLLCILLIIYHFFVFVLYCYHVMVNKVIYRMIKMWSLLFSYKQGIISWIRYNSGSYNGRRTGNQLICGISHGTIINELEWRWRSLQLSETCLTLKPASRNKHAVGLSYNKILQTQWKSYSVYAILALLIRVDKQGNVSFIFPKTFFSDERHMTWQ